MPSSTDPGVRREGDVLAFSGPLLRDGAGRVWPAALRLLDGVRRFDLEAVPRIDSAGLALLSELAGRAGGGIAIDGEPDGLSELRAAYRMQTDLDLSRT